MSSLKFILLNFSYFLFQRESTALKRSRVRRQGGGRETHENPCPQKSTELEHCILTFPTDKEISPDIISPLTLQKCLCIINALKAFKF